MLKIRLMRIGAKKRPFYRVVVVDERTKRTGAYIELLGTYNPLTEPKDIQLKQDRIDHWIKQGAQMSEGFLRIIGKAPQHPPRKPKKEAKQPKEETSAPAPVEEKTAEVSEQKEVVVDNSAEETKPEGGDSTESVQKENEGSA